MIAHVYLIKREHSKKEIITERRKFSVFYTLTHAAFIYTIMATALQCFLCIPNMVPPKHVQNGTYGMLKFNTPRIQTLDGYLTITHYYFMDIR